MGFKNSPGCGCCGEEGPCCVAAKRYFMDREGHTTLRFSGGYSGGPFSTFRTKQIACIGGSSMSTQIWPAIDFSADFDRTITRNTTTCYYSDGPISNAPNPSFSDIFEVGAGRMPEHTCSGSFSCYGLIDNVLDPLGFSQAATLNYYCEQGSYHYQLGVIATVTYYNLNSLPVTVPVFPGVDWTVSTSPGRTVYHRNTGDATVAFITVSYGLLVQAGTVVTDTPSVTMWVPNPVVDPLGLTEYGTASIIT